MAEPSNSVPPRWDATKIPSQKGKKVIVTGANSGIGYVTALELARHGADVVLACRSEAKASEAVKAIQDELGTSLQAGSVELRQLELGSLASVQAFADGIKKSHDRLDMLINNAGIMAVPYTETVDGYESQFATNHIGHFALTAQLLELLKKSDHARIVNVSSIAHEYAKVDLKQIMTSRTNYNEWTAYSNSKLFNLLFMRELNRRLQAKGISNVVATAAHPGFSTTNLSIPMFDNFNWFMRILGNLLWLLPIKQSPEFGALPTLYAAVGKNIEPNDYIGPDGFRGYTGYPTKTDSTPLSKSQEVAQTLWEESERLAKLTFMI